MTLEPCTWHHASDAGMVTVWPEEYRQWARAATSARARPGETTMVTKTVAASPAQKTRADTGALTIVAPLAGALYLYDPTLRREFQMLPLRARGGDSGQLQWFVDGAPVGTGGHDEALRWPLARGAHAIVVRDAAGQTADTRIVVR